MYVVHNQKRLNITDLDKLSILDKVIDLKFFVTIDTINVTSSLKNIRMACYRLNLVARLKRHWRLKKILHKKFKK